MKGDQGAVAVIVALLAVVLFGFAALVIDIAVLFHERRQLQNGADAVALSVAYGCAGGACGSATATATAQSFVTENHDSSSPPGTPGRGKLTQLCGVAPPEGSVLLPLPLCTHEADLATKYPGNYVVARTASGTQEGAAGLAPILAGILPGGQLPTTVPARAVVRWGTPGSLATRLPVTMSKCRWELMTKFGTSLPPTPTSPSTWVEGSYPKNDATRLLEAEQSLITGTAVGKDPYNDDTCASTEQPAPGNFNWLETAPGKCEATLEVGDVPTYDNSTGKNVPDACKTTLQHLVGSVVGVPIYSSTPDGGSVGSYTYETDGFAAFYVTGLYLNCGPGCRVDSNILAAGSNKHPCKNPTFCISGFFVDGAVDGELGGGGTDYGLQVVQMAY